MILYFSGTGNSRFVAEKISETADDEIASINDIMKAGQVPTLESEKPYVFVLPVYAGRMPRVVEKCIEGMTLKGSKQAYFIMTCFETPYKSEKYIKRLCAKKRMQIIGFDYVCLPQSYIAMYDVPDHEEAVEIYKAALPDIKRISDAIRDHSRFDNSVNGGGMMSSIINPIFYKTSVSAKGFHTNEKCTGCGQCEEHCPLNNVKLNNGMPKWGNSCTHCMACIDGCPQHAIEYKNATAGKSRNFNIGAEI